jgi:hypothetical protein
MFLDWDRYAEWAAETGVWLDDRFGPALLDRLRPSEPDDWMEWLDREHAAGGGATRSVVEDFSYWLRARYQGIRIVHATRLPGLTAVRESGLRAWTGGELRTRARAAFVNRSGEDQLNQAIEQCAPDHRGGRVYSFSSLDYAIDTSEGHLPGRLPQFATAGGEYFGCLRDRLGLHEGEETRAGRAYLLGCNMLWDRLESHIVNTLIRDALGTALVLRCFPQDNYTRRSSLECVSVDHDILPDEIEWVSDVEHLVGRTDLAVTDIVWSAFAPN